MRQLLCNHPDEVTHFSMSGKQPLHIATIWGNTEMVHLLLSLGAPVDGRTRNSKRTPLFYAAKSRNFIISSELLKAGANPHAQDIFQKTPIHMAQRTKRIHGGEMLKLLERYSQ